MALSLLTEVDLDMNAPIGTTVVHAKQNDASSRVIRAHLLNNGVAWAVPTKTSIAIRYKKPDNTGGYYDKYYEASGGAKDAIAFPTSSDHSYIDIVLAQQALTVPGTVPMELNFYDASGASLSTFSWYLKVQESSVTDRDVMSSDYYMAFSDMMAQIVKAGNNLPDDLGAAVAEWLQANYQLLYDDNRIAIDNQLKTAGAAADAKAAGRVFVYSDTEPSEVYNRVWFKPSAAIVQVPTMEEFNALVERVETLENLHRT